MVVRRPGWCIAALLLALADSTAALAQRDAAAHRALLQFDSTSALDVNSVVAGVTALVHDVVDAVAAGVHLPGATASSEPPSSSNSNTPSPPTTQPPAYTAAPVADTVAPATYTPAPAPSVSTSVPIALTTDAPAATEAANTLAPSASSSEPPSPPAVTPDAAAATETSTLPTDAPIAGVDEPNTSSSSAYGATPAPSPIVVESSAPTPPVPAAIDSLPPAPAAVAADGSSSGTGANRTVVDTAKLEDNVLPAAPSAAPTELPANLSTASAAPPVAPPALPAAPKLPEPLTPIGADKSAASLAGAAGQVHAPHFSGSMAQAVQGVSKNAADDSIAPSPSPTKRPKRLKAPATSGGDTGSSHAADSTSSTSSQSSSVTSSTSSGSMYSLGTSSILSIVGVLVGIGAIVALFAVISRKKYGSDASDDDDRPLPYGFRIDGGGHSIVRLSPTFLTNNESSMIGGGLYGNGNGVHAVDGSDGTSSSGESGEEKAPYFGSSYGFDNYLAQSRLAKSGLVGGAYSSSGTEAAVRRSDSALLAADLKSSSIYSSELSDGSESWSSVLASERAVSRCTRDTRLSGLTSAAPSESSRRHTRFSRSTFGDALCDVNYDSSRNYRTTRASSPALAPAAALGDSQSSHASSFYRDGSRGYSDTSALDMRSTGAGSSIYSVGSPSPFDV